MRRFMRMDRYPERGAARRRTDETMDRRRYRQWNCHWETIRYLNSSKKLLLTAKAQRAQRFFSIKKALLNFKWVKKARQEKRNPLPRRGGGSRSRRPVGSGDYPLVFQQMHKKLDVFFASFASLR